MSHSSVGKMAVVISGPFEGIRGVVQHEAGDVVTLAVTEKAYELANKRLGERNPFKNHCTWKTYSGEPRIFGIQVEKKNIEVL